MILQPDLFGEIEAEERARQKHVCPLCGLAEPNGVLLAINHGLPAGHHTRCVAMRLTLRHVEVEISRLIGIPHGYITPASGRNTAAAQESLCKSLAHARRRWVNRIEELEAELARLPIKEALAMPAKPHMNQGDHQ